MPSKPDRLMDVPVEVRRAVYEAVDAGDVKKLRTAARRAPAVLLGGWSGQGGATFLHLAASKGRTDVCAELVDLGVDVNVAESTAHLTPLDSAATRGHEETVRWFLAHGALVDGRPTSVATPLIGAAVGGHLAIARALLDAGAEVNREHLRLPETALDFAEAYRVKHSGQDAVAALLRERGGLRPYTDDHDWSRVPGREYIQYIEHVIGSVHPVGLTAEAARGRTITVRKAVVAPRCEYKLLFSVGLARVANTELALAMPWGWPLNRGSLELPRFKWPLTLLGHLGGLAGDGEPLLHGGVIDAAHAVPKTAGVPPEIVQWLALNHVATDEGRDAEPRTLLLTPVIAKKPLTGAAARALADKKARGGWKALALPLPVSETD